MRIHTFTNKFKISSKNKIAFYLIKGVMKFISAKPNIIASCFEMITLIFRIKYCIALCFGIANIIMIGKYTNRALCHDTSIKKKFNNQPAFFHDVSLFWVYESSINQHASALSFHNALDDAPVHCLP